MQFPQRHRLRGFTLIELVVVVMILGILAAVAAPKLLNTTRTATDGSATHTLSVLRDAIDSYAAHNSGTLPGADGVEATFKTNLAPHIRGGSFPECPVGTAKNAAVRMLSGTGSHVPGIAASAGTQSWVYHYETGDFHINSTDMSADGVRTYDKF